MGYVQESRTNPPWVTDCYRTIGQQAPGPKVQVSMGTGSATQSGFRSGPLTDAEMEELGTLSANGKWSDTPTYIKALEKMETALTPHPVNRGASRVVNNRDYAETRTSPTTLTFTYGNTARPGSIRRNVGALGIIGIRLLPLIDEDQAAAKAGSALRAVRPTAPDVNLARMAGELRQARDLFPEGIRLGSPSLAGKTDLMYEFGWKPTVEDVTNLGKMVIRNRDRFRQFVRDSGRIVHRSGSIVLEDENTESLFTPSTAGWDRILEHNNVKFRMAHNDGYAYRREPAFRVVCNRRLTLRYFASFEYFASAPRGFGNSVDSYAARARKLLGGGLNASTMYQLAPYSWLLDWFVDFGSVIDYQEDVADYSLVMRRCGWVLESYGTAQVSAVPRSTTADYNLLEAGGSATCVQKLQVRRPGSPYSLSPNWPVNASQGRILTALGLSKLIP